MERTASLQMRAGRIVFSMALVVLVACVAALCLGGADRAYAIGKGQTFTKGGNVYKVIDEAHGNDLSEVMLVKYGSSNTKPVVNAVSYQGERFKVDTIGQRAFDTAQGHKITSITLGRHVDNIYAKAFRGCTKLKAIDMHAADVIEIEKKCGSYYLDDLDIATNAFAKACTASVKVKCGSNDASYKKVYKAALLKTGMPSGVKVIA